MKKWMFFFVVFFHSAKSSLAQLPDKISMPDKLYGASKFWQEVNYNFVFLDKVNKSSWDSMYRSTLTNILATKNDLDYYKELEKLCAFLKDGHTNVYYPKALADQMMITMFGEYRIFLGNIEDKAIITRVNASKKDELPPGSELLKINGLPVKLYAEKYVVPYISSSTNHVLQNETVYNLLKGYKGDTFNIVIKTASGLEKPLSLVHSNTKEQAVFPPFENRGLLDFKKYDNGIHYLALNSFDNEQIEKKFKEVLPELYNAKAVILDLRYNGGGNTMIGFNILQYFTSDSLLYGSKSVTRQHWPAYKAWGSFLKPSDTLSAKPEWDMTKADMVKSYLVANDLYYYEFPLEPTRISITEKRIQVPVAVIFGNNTASAAEDFLIYADQLPHFTFIGDRSYGSTGQPYLFPLPGGGRARVCTKKDSYPDGKAFVGVGVIPDITVKPTLQDHLQQKDPVLERAIKLLHEKL